MTTVLRDAQSTRLQVSASDAERARFWAGRKAAFPAAGRAAPAYYCMDGTIPRRRVGEMLGRIRVLEDRFQLRCPNVFHAGDGNLHPLILFDDGDPADSNDRRSGPSPTTAAASPRGPLHHHYRVRRPSVHLSAQDVRTRRCASGPPAQPALEGFVNGAAHWRR